LIACATFFATDRSIEHYPRLLHFDDLNDEERRAREILRAELFDLHDEAQLAIVTSRVSGTQERQRLSVLACRLRQLRQQQWPDKRITQQELARALSRHESLSAATVSAWESTISPKLPPIHRLEAYATFFATYRSVEHYPPLLLDLADLSDAERRAREILLAGLLELRNQVWGSTIAR
jgi:transcriptional regulator with XRE-family HTH domain